MRARGLVGAVVVVGLTAACEGALPPAPPPAASLGLPPLPASAADPLRAGKVALGKRLFFDRDLSRNGTMSCAMCHLPEQGFTSNELATPVGLDGRTVRRNAPTLLNVAFQRRLFHDGREAPLEDQIWGPLLAANEMGNPSIGYVLERIRTRGEYAGQFEAAFGGQAVSAMRLGQALAAYQRTLVAGNSPFDRWRYGGDPAALTAVEQHGFELFAGRARCSTCHTVGERDALFTDHGFHNTGVGWRRTFAAPRRTRVQLAPGVFTELDRSTVDRLSEPPVQDVGRYEITLAPRDRWAYRTPSLRNVALTAPYMHDGSLPTLEAVIEFYDGGGADNPEKSALVARLDLTAEERAALVALLRTLTGANVRALVEETRRDEGPPRTRHRAAGARPGPR